VVPENEGIHVPIPTGAQTVPLADPHWSQNGGRMNGINATFPFYSGRAKKGPKTNLYTIPR
jgi:hypothetical protein